VHPILLPHKKGFIPTISPQSSLPTTAQFQNAFSPVLSDEYDDRERHMRRVMVSNSGMFCGDPTSVVEPPATNNAKVKGQRPVAPNCSNIDGKLSSHFFRSWIL
jgi:hypothetical protein